jgi:hypothetical protein
MGNFGNIQIEIIIFFCSKFTKDKMNLGQAEKALQILQVRILIPEF